MRKTMSVKMARQRGGCIAAGRRRARRPWQPHIADPQVISCTDCFRNGPLERIRRRRLSRLRFHGERLRIGLSLCHGVSTLALLSLQASLYS
eukprot:COSAG03_NODE_2275_length_2925_cov_2.778839_4_plen_92_part_00